MAESTTAPNTIVGVGGGEGGENGNKMLTLLPLSRVRTIMKQCPDISALSQESIFLITRATELFIELMTRESYDIMEEKYKSNQPERTSQIIYKDLASVVDKYDCLVFLSDIVPQKITVREYYKLLQEEEEEENKENGNEKET